MERFKNVDLEVNWKVYEQASNVTFHKTPRGMHGFAFEVGALVAGRVLFPVKDELKKYQNAT
jgi:hypothetical protein